MANFNVRNLINDNGNAAANQFIIYTPKATYFQSYESVVAKIDRKGNLIRLNDEAINTIDIHELFTGQTKALRGRRYTINLTINPTYLYMLSDPDLDNPTVIIDN
jgi:hypothetical protein